MRDLFDAFIKWRQSWEPVFQKEREERKRQREERNIKDVDFMEVKDDRNE